MFVDKCIFGYLVRFVDGDSVYGFVVSSGILLMEFEHDAISGVLRPYVA